MTYLITLIEGNRLRQVRVGGFCIAGHVGEECLLDGAVDRFDGGLQVGAARRQDDEFGTQSRPGRRPAMGGLGRPSSGWGVVHARNGVLRARVDLAQSTAGTTNGLLLKPVSQRALNG
jgi:hypothetical protein